MSWSLLHEANSWVQSEKKQVWSQKHCNNGLLVRAACTAILRYLFLHPGVKAGVCWQKSLTLKCISWAQLAEMLKKQVVTEVSFTSYLQLDLGEAFSVLCLATTVVQGAVQASLEAVYPIWLGMNPTAAQQSWGAWACLRKTHKTQISKVIPTFSSKAARGLQSCQGHECLEGVFSCPVSGNSQVDNLEAVPSVQKPTILLWDQLVRDTYCFVLCTAHSSKLPAPSFVTLGLTWQAYCSRRHV